ncbi:CotH kinase family protein [Akkermansiaceae bacterium]|nr:CotH kinase family protein [Akkermansiaceae bacterium]
MSEFLASNTKGLTDEDGDDSDWIELTNVSGSVVDLAGWHLTDDAAVLDQWEFPAVTLNPGDELVVFASNKNRAIAGEELHTNFKLSSSGEYLALVRADGVTVEDGFSPSYPQQYPDISYGTGTPGGSTVQLVGPDQGAKYKVPSDSSEDVGGASPWNEWAFDDSSWTSFETGVGFATSTSTDPYDAYIGTGGDIQSAFYTENTTVYLRIPFTVDDPTVVTGLLFRARYDDGFAIYINGSPILASANPPDDGVWDFEADAGGTHNDTLAIALESFSVDLNQVTLLAGENILAVHGLNRGANSSDFLFDCELDAQLSPGGGTVKVYMNPPTPDSANAGGVTSLGPAISEVTENPVRPDLSVQNDLLVTARVGGTENGVDEVTLFYRANFASESSLLMTDDGVSPDGIADDGIFSASVPLGGPADGEMIRWRVEAEDSAGTISKAPFFADPLNSPEYFGTAAIDALVVSNLPVLEWFIENPSGANGRTGTRASVVYLGEFYDNIFCRIRGASSAGLAKKSFKFDFNTGYHFKVAEDPDSVRVEEFNLNTTWTDKAYVRQPLSYDIYDLAGSPGSQCFLTRVEQNGEFFSVAAYTEQVDKRLLRREKGIDDDGALYKMFNGGTSGTSGVEKKNRTHESNADLSAFVSGIGGSGTSLENFIFDNVDLPRQLNYLAATVLTQNNDNMKKNYYLYRDTEGSGEWTQLPWDTDLTWGSHYMTNDAIAHDGIWATADYVLGGRSANAPISPSHPFVGVQELPGNRSFSHLIDKLLENDRVKEMFKRRLQTLVDEVLMTSELDDRVDAFELALGNDAVLDRSKWGQFGTSQSLAQAIGILEDDYIGPRRTHLSVTHLASNTASYPTAQTSSALLPGPQVATPNVIFGSFDANPVSGNQNEEYLEIQNPTSEAIDLSGWSIQGGIDFTFLPGTIIEANRSLYLSPDVSSFRSRGASPQGGEGLNVEGDYSGQISSRGETLSLLAPGGASVASITTPSNPSSYQDSLRITELHFSPLGGKDFEFVELRNIGTTPLDLAGVYFDAGITVTLTGTLDPGEFGLVVANPVNYPGQKILGTFTGALNNGGDQLTLRDPVGENILSFRFEGEWFTPAQDHGYSIEIVNDGGDWWTWDSQLSWALSCDVHGSPGVMSPGFSHVYSSWSAQYFTVSELADLTVSGPMADASGDGFSNLLKYALGLDPTVKTPVLPVIVEVEGDELTSGFTRLEKTPDISVIVEVSTDLSSWAPTSSLISSSSNGDGTENVTFQSNATVSGEARQFLRIKVTQE